MRFIKKKLSLSKKFTTLTLSHSISFLPSISLTMLHLVGRHLVSYVLFKLLENDISATVPQCLAVQWLVNGIYQQEPPIPTFQKSPFASLTYINVEGCKSFILSGNENLNQYLKVAYFLLNYIASTAS